MSSYRDIEAEFQAGLDEYDIGYYRAYGRLPEESTLTVEQVQAALRGSERRARIAALVEQGATEGERQAARAALARFDASHSETDRMQRGGNWSEE